VIFVTVGAQRPFDRLVHAVDQWARRRGRDDVFAQVGRTDAPPTHIQWVEMLDPIDYRNRFWQADVVVAHAGAGTIITAMEMSKPLLVMPRLKRFSETRSNHQVATAWQFAQRTNLRLAEDELQLVAAMDSIGQTRPLSRIGAYASFELLSSVRRFIDLGEAPQSALHSMDADASAVIGRTADHQHPPTRRKAA